MGASHKKPPFRKGGLGGFYTYTYIYTPPRNANNLMRGGTAAAGGVLLGMRRCFHAAPGKSPQPPFCERGAF